MGEEKGGEVGGRDTWVGAGVRTGGGVLLEREGGLGGRHGTCEEEGEERGLAHVKRREREVWHV